MLRIALPNPTLRTEQKRNLILRIRYGSLHYGLQDGAEENAKFLIQGHSVAHKPPKRTFPPIPDYGRRQFHKNPGSKNVMLGITSSKLPTLLHSKSKQADKFSKNEVSLESEENLDPSTNNLTLDERFRYGSNLFKATPLEAVHEHSEEDGQINSSGSKSNKLQRHKTLPAISTSVDRKMSQTRKFSKEIDLDYYKRKNPSRAGSFSAWSTSSDVSQTKLPLGRRRSKQWKSKDSSRRSSKAESVELEVTAWYGFHESQENEKHIWFDYPGIDLTYVDVQQALEKVVPDAFETKKIISILFENVNVKLADTHSKNKWHVELSDLVTKKKLVDSGLIFPKPLLPRSTGKAPLNRSISRTGR